MPSAISIWNERVLFLCERQSCVHCLEYNSRIKSMSNEWIKPTRNGWVGERASENWEKGGDRREKNGHGRRTERKRKGERERGLNQNSLYEEKIWTDVMAYATKAGKIGSVKEWTTHTAKKNCMLGIKLDALFTYTTTIHIVEAVQIFAIKLSKVK